MAAFVLVSLGVVLRYAGEWGVPYFSFTTDRGSSCTNDSTGYTCDQLTLADLEFYGDVDLPPDTAVVAGVYRATHDFSLNAQLLVPERSAAGGLKALNAAYGICRSGQLSPLPAGSVTKLCVMANDDAVTGSSEVSSRLYTVGTGLRKDGARLVALSMRSR